MTYTEQMLNEAHDYSRDNRGMLKTGLAGCFYCCTQFPAVTVTRWIDKSSYDKGHQTALCPHCGIDSVLPKLPDVPVDEPEFLTAMHERWFSSNKKETT